VRVHIDCKRHIHLHIAFFACSEFVRVNSHNYIFLFCHILSADVVGSELEEASVAWISVTTADLSKLECIQRTL
jgi:hypothetical protein